MLHLVHDFLCRFGLIDLNLHHRQRRLKDINVCHATLHYSEAYGWRTGSVIERFSITILALVQSEPAGSKNVYVGAAAIPITIDATFFAPVT